MNLELWNTIDTIRDCIIPDRSTVASQCQQRMIQELSEQFLFFSGPFTLCSTWWARKLATILFPNLKQVQKSRNKGKTSTSLLALCESELWGSLLYDIYSCIYCTYILYNFAFLPTFLPTDPRPLVFWVILFLYQIEHKICVWNIS